MPAISRVVYVALAVRLRAAVDRSVATMDPRMPCSSSTMARL
jgi:hypothetical protein